jgi:nucleoside-diphosphate-sugar epimerase
MANILGPDPKVSSQKNQLQYNFNLLAQDKDVELFGDGLFYRDFLHVEDAARAIEIVLSKGNAGEVYNIGNGHPGLYYRDILEYAKQKMHSSGNIIYKQPTEFQAKTPVSSFYMNNDKLKSLGYVPNYLGNKLYDSLIQEK